VPPYQKNVIQFFKLHGKNMEALDRRLHAYRDDLADVRLRNQYYAAAYVDGTPGHIICGAADLRSEPDGKCRIDTQLLYGENITIFERKDGWAWVQADTDGYVGYIKESAIAATPTVPSHCVSNLRTFIYPEPDLKAPPLRLISMNSPLQLTEKKHSGFQLLEEGDWVVAGHLSKIDNHEDDPCEIALRFIGTPYLWGGRTSLGLDCSALVQMSLLRCGISVPRDSDMQEKVISRPATGENDLSHLKRGDLIYWRGHCGIWIDSFRFIHANATDMAVAIQPLECILEHLSEATGDNRPRIRRP
tara:strand:+ start:9747 stop:10655 length:909 start_codon:yes stop_codon:yes gene_type:complete